MKNIYSNDITIGICVPLKVFSIRLNKEKIIVINIVYYFNNYFTFSKNPFVIGARSLLFPVFDQNNYKHEINKLMRWKVVTTIK